MYVVQYRRSLSQEIISSTGVLLQTTVFPSAGWSDAYSGVQSSRALETVHDWITQDVPLPLFSSVISVC